MLSRTLREFDIIVLLSYPEGGLLTLDRVKRLPDHLFATFLKLLVEHRGPFLERLDTVTIQVLDTLIKETEFEFTEADLPRLMQAPNDLLKVDSES